MAESIKRFDLHRLPAPMLHGGKWCSTKVLVPAGRILYQGSYWTDEEVKLSGTVCTAKLFKYKICEEKELLFHYERISSLHHPNVVEFFGMYSIPTHELPVLVTKHMEGSLHDLLVKVKDHVLPLSVKQNILLDVSQGLYFLHDHEPSVVHAQLTARNILLDSAAEKAKILMTYIPFSEREKVYNDPGVGMYFIHDEVKDLCRHYTSVYHAMPATDIFSFGHLALLTLIQDVCIQLKPKNGETEIDRRRSSFSMLSIKLGKNNLLIDLVEECLQDSPDERPNADNLVSRISEESSRAKEPSEHMLSKIINEHFKPDKLNKIQQPGDDKDVLLAENEALKNELEECKVKLDKVNESLPTGENGVASQSGSAMTNKMDKSSPSAKSGGASESGSDTTNKMDESLPTGENGVASQSGSATTNKSKKERARKFLTKRADYLLDKYSDITALDIDCQDGDVCILVWIKSGSAVKDQLLQEDFDGLAVDVRVGEMRCTMDKSSPSAKSGGASESGSDTTNKDERPILRNGDPLKLLKEETYGTLSCFAVDRDGRVGLIGCYHTLNALNDDDPKTRRKVVVPCCNGAYDKVVVANVTMQEHNTTCYNHNVDCAFAVLTPCMENHWELWMPQNMSLLGKVKYDTLKHLWENDEGICFFFYGCTSKLTKTAIKSCDHTERFIYSGHEYRLHNLLRLQAPSQGGDSGALVVMEQGGKAAGIIIGNCPEEHAIATSIELVENFLQVRLITRATFIELQYD